VQLVVVELRSELGDEAQAGLGVVLCPAKRWT
jgi:hypothetical protein